MNLTSYTAIYVKEGNTLQQYIVVPTRTEIEQNEATVKIAELTMNHERVHHVPFFLDSGNTDFISDIIRHIASLSSYGIRVPIHTYSSVIENLNELGIILESQKDEDKLNQLSNASVHTNDSYTEISGDMEVIRSAKALVKKHYLDDLSKVNKRVLENASIALDEVLAGLNKSRDRFDK